MGWNPLQWTLGYTYSANGHLASQSYPDGLVVQYSPNALGQPTRAGAYATGVTYHPNGAVKQFTYGNGLVHTLTQNLRQLPDTSADRFGTTAVLSDSYDFDGNGNVAAITDGATGRNQRGNRTMAYDGLDRLTSVNSPMFNGTIRYTYDVLDNIVTVTAPQNGATPARNLRNCYQGNRLAFVRSGATNCTNGAATMTLSYDAQGNVASRNNVAYSFDYGNRLRSVAGIASYVYDGLGRRVSDQTAGSKYSLYTSAGQLAFTHDKRKAIDTNYIYLAGSLVMLRERNTASNVYTNKYLHTDALGSPVAVTDVNRKVLERIEYEPFGKVVNATPKDGPGFTGHVFDAATGMLYMQQRYYDPICGCFLSIDPLTAYDQPIAAFNRYRYANSNPYKFTDPDGRFGRPDPPYMRITTENRAQNSNGSVTVQRITSASDMAPPPPTGGTVVLLPQRSAGGEPATLGRAVEERLLNFSEKVGKTVEVTSGQRTPEQNAAVGGAPASQHLSDNAADIRIQGNTPAQTADAAHQSGEFNRINEYTNGRGVHVDLREDGNQGRFDNWRPRSNE